MLVSEARLSLSCFTEAICQIHYENFKKNPEKFKFTRGLNIKLELKIIRLNQHVQQQVYQQTL